MSKVRTLLAVVSLLVLSGVCNVTVARAASAVDHRWSALPGGGGRQPAYGIEVNESWKGRAVVPTPWCVQSRRGLSARTGAGAKGVRLEKAAHGDPTASPLASPCRWERLRSWERKVILSPPETEFCGRKWVWWMGMPVPVACYGTLYRKTYECQRRSFNACCASGTKATKWGLCSDRIEYRLECPEGCSGGYIMTWVTPRLLPTDSCSPCAGICE